MARTLRNTSKSLVRALNLITQLQGLTLRTSPIEHLPFDEALDRTVIALREQALVSEQTIADRRRNVPSKVHDLLADLLERQRAAEISLSAAEMAAAEAAGADSRGDSDEFCGCPSLSIACRHSGTNIGAGWSAGLAFVAQHAQLDEVMTEAQSAAKQLNTVSTGPHFPLVSASNASPALWYIPLDCATSPPTRTMGSRSVNRARVFTECTPRDTMMHLLVS
jgi:hypothetical protein